MQTRMLQDFRYAIRNLRRGPIFTLVALLSLALGIGANTAVFTIADQVLLRPIPVGHARDLVHFTSPGPQSGFVTGENRFSYPMFRDFRDHNTVFRNIAARFDTALNITYNNRSERINAELVSGTYFDTLGLATSIGRGITPDDDRLPGAHPVVVLTNAYWRSRFSANSGILNQTVLLNGHPMTVIGVTAPGYHGFDVGQRIDALVPTMMKHQMTPTWDGLADRRTIWLQLIACLNPDVSIAGARASLEPYYHGLLIMEMQSMQLRQSRRAAFASKPLIFEPAAKGVSDLRDGLAEPLEILLAVVGLLLLIACANVANLLLARAVNRRKEIAVRLALGAGRWVLMRQLLTESLLLSLAGGAVGILFAWWTGAALLGMFSGSSGSPLTAAPDARIFAFTFVISAVTGVLFGLAPAWQATSPKLAGTLKDQAGNVSAGGGHVRLRRILVVSQVALSLLMLIGATLFARSLHNLRNVDLGFRPDHLLSFSVDPSLGGYNAARIRGFAEDLRQRAGGVHGVRSAAVGTVSVITGDMSSSTIHIAGRVHKEEDDMNPWFDTVSPGYFQTMEIPLIAGRDFTDRDRAGAPRVAIVNDVFARYYFGNENPIGRHFGTPPDSRPTDIEIIGVVHGSKYSKVDEKIPKVIFLVYAQDDNPSSLVLYARASADPPSLFSALRRESNAIDPSLPVTAMRTMDDQVDEALSSQRMVAGLSAAFGSLATLLAAIGLYRVMAYTVSRRTREIGIRVALGAGRGSLLRLVMREVVALTTAGVLIAIPVALALTRLVRAELYGVAPTDPLSVVLAVLALVGVALLAGYIPAERAARVNPISALRYE